MGHRYPSKACILHPSSSAQPRQGTVNVSLAVRHGLATAPGMSTGPCGPIAATLDIDTAPLLCFGCSLVFSGSCFWETFPAKWLIHHLLLFGLQRKCGSFLCNLCLQGQHQNRVVLQSLTVHISHQKITASPSQSASSSGTP